MSLNYSDINNQILGSIQEIQHHLGESPEGRYANVRVRLDILEAKLNSILEAKLNSINYSKSIIGEQGPQGPQGDVGIQGLSGKDGIQGPVGVRGSTGLQGAIGLQGKLGSQGYQGNIGETGSIGLQGYQGKIGIQGLQGSVGKSGNNGLQGFQGEIGFQGEKGFQGQTGLQGEAGLQGVIGQQGNIGDIGPQGYIGQQGQQGYRGYQGYSGVPGENGLQGAQGESGATINCHSILSGNVTNILPNDTTYFSIFGPANKLENNVLLHIPLNCILSNLFITLNEQLEDSSIYNFTVRKNNFDTLLSIKMSGPQNSGFNIVNDVTFNTGDIFSISITSSNGKLIENLSAKWTCKVTSI